MAPEESKVLKDHLKAAAILLNNTPKEELQSFNSIELAVREHLLKEVVPEIHNVKIHKTESKRLTDVHIAAAWESSSKEYWYILSTEPTTVQTFWKYGLRFDIEENFLDDKSRL